MTRRPITVLVAVATLASMFACAKKPPPPFETPSHALDRLITKTTGPMPSSLDEPGTYTIRFDRYTTATGTNAKEPHGLVTIGARKLRALNAVHLVRTVTRPFDETVKGPNSTRHLGFVNDQPNHRRRVVLLRPLPDDPRPRVYPLPGEKIVTVYDIAGRKCMFHTDAVGTYCIDRTGLILASDDGKTVELATRVTLNQDAMTVSAITAQLAPGFVDTDAGSIRPIDPISSPPGQTDYALPIAPDGFSFVGRYAVVALSDALLERTSRKVAAGIVDVYVRGLDAIVVDRGGRLDTSSVTDHDLGALDDEQSVDLGALGTARAGIAGLGPFGYREVRLAPSHGRYVVVAGTVPLEELVALARTLKASPGTQLVYLDRRRASS